MEVEIIEGEDGKLPPMAPPQKIPLLPPSSNTPIYPLSDGTTPAVVHAEEVLLISVVLIIWVAAIALFINRWGKIRMLEPYQPKFHQNQHRPSCPLAPLSPTPPVGLAQQRMSFSKYNVNALTDPLSVLPSPIIRRPRQNSVFVGSPSMAPIIYQPTPPRRTKSAMDIQNLITVHDRSSSSLSGRKGSVIPILNRDRSDRRPSITIERPPPTFHHSAHRHRTSLAVDRPMLSLQQYRSRRSSCFVERPVIGRHRNFTSFEHSAGAPHSVVTDRKASIIDRPSCSFHHYHHPQPIINFEPHFETSEEPLINAAEASICPHMTSFISETVPALTLPKLSRSFEQPPKRKTKPEPRMANSLECGGSVTNFDQKRPSLPEEDRNSSDVMISLDEMNINLTAPLLEKLKSSDV